MLARSVSASIATFPWNTTEPTSVRTPSATTRRAVTARLDSPVATASMTALTLTAA